MAELTQGEQILYAKYWGDKELFLNPQFWKDAFAYYSSNGLDLPLPVVYEPCKMRQLMSILHCPPGKCGRCCHYRKVYIGQGDIDRIAENTEYSRNSIEGMLEPDDKGMYLPCKDGCPFIKDGLCSIYQYRPDTCWLFPFQVGREAFYNGKPFQRVMLRLVCAPALDVARKVIGEALKDGKRMLLPDLTLIPIYEGE